MDSALLFFVASSFRLAPDLPQAKTHVRVNASRYQVGLRLSSYDPHLTLIPTIHQTHICLPRLVDIPLFIVIRGCYGCVESQHRHRHVKPLSSLSDPQSPPDSDIHPTTTILHLQISDTGLTIPIALPLFDPSFSRSSTRNFYSASR